MNTHQNLMLDAASPENGWLFSTPMAREYPGDSAAFTEFQATIEGLAELVALVDSDGIIRTINDHWRRATVANGTPGFLAGGNYPGALMALIEQGDGRVQPILEGFAGINAGIRESFQCLYVGSGILSGHDYNVHLSRIEVGGRWHVLVSAEDLSEVNALKRERRRAGTKILRAQENERKRIARELHDSTSQLLVALQLNLMNLGAAGSGPESEALIADCKKVLQDVHREIRSFSFMAHPPSLPENGLGQALEALARGFAARTGLEIDLRISDVGEASASIEAAIYRMTQEALANIHRHALAGRATVQLVGTRRCLHLTVGDDGIGFDAAEGRKRQSMGVGILGMAERVSEFGGRFSVHRAPDKGTMVRLTLPRLKR